MAKIEEKVDKILTRVNKIVTDVALSKQNIRYIKKEIEGNGRKGILERMDNIEEFHTKDITGINKTVNRVMGGLILGNIIIVPIIMIITTIALNYLFKK